MTTNLLELQKSNESTDITFEFCQFLLQKYIACIGNIVIIILGFEICYHPIQIQVTKTMDFWLKVIIKDAK